MQDQLRLLVWSEIRKNEKIRFLSPPPTKSMIWRDVAIRSPSYQQISNGHSLYSLQTRSSQLFRAVYIFRIFEHRPLCNSTTKWTTTKTTTTSCDAFIVPVHWKKQRNSNRSHYTMWQQVKHNKRWNSFDLIADVDDLNNLNNFVVKEFIFVKTSECHCIATISTLIETLPNIRINKVAIDYAPLSRFWCFCS